MCRALLTRKMNSSSTLQSLIPRSRTVRNLLIELASLWKRKQSGENVEIPMVTLHLTSGKDISGWLMEAGAMEVGATVFLRPHLAAPGTQQSLVLCAEFSRIEAVSLRRTPQRKSPETPVQPRKEVLPPKIRFQSENTSLLPVDEISVNQLQRILLSLESRFSAALNNSVKIEVGWKSIGEDGKALIALRELATLVRKSVDELLTTPYRREELRRLFQIIRFEAGTKTEITFTNETLVIRAPLNQGNPGYTSAEAFSADLLSIL